MMNAEYGWAGWSYTLMIPRDR